MQHRVMGYDRTATMFSPDGRLLQVEYAEKTVRMGSATVGIVCQDGILMVADRRIIDPLLITPNMKIWEIDDHVLASAAGILSDARVLIERAQVVCQQHRVTYDQPIATETIIRDLADIQQSATQYAGARPFGIEVMISGVDKDNSSRLYVSHITGNYLSYKAFAIGENDDKIKEMLRTKFKEMPTIEKGIKITLGIFRKVFGKNFDIRRFEVAYINKSDKKAKRLHGEALAKYVK